MIELPLKLWTVLHPTSCTFSDHIFKLSCRSEILIVGVILRAATRLLFRSGAKETPLGAGKSANLIIIDDFKNSGRA